MSEKKNKESEQLKVIRRVNADVFIMLDNDVIKALSNNIPIDLVCSKSQKVVIKSAIDTGGDISFRLVRKTDDTEEN